MSKIKRTNIILAIVSVAIIVIAVGVGIQFWRTNMAIAIDNSLELLVGETDVADIVNYQTMTNTFLTGFAIAFLSSWAGIIIDCIVWMIYGVILLAIKGIQKMRKAEAEAQTAAKLSKK